MFKQIKVLLLIACALNLSACLKVENKSDGKVADAITEQNKILQQQADQTKTSISLIGIIYNLSTGTKATNATVTVKIGTTITAPVAADTGTFQVNNLPADSDFELVVHSTTGAFKDRTLFSKTRATNSLGSVYQDIGNINVSVGVERTFTILNSVTNAAITNLKLQANSNIGDGANFEQYLHKATYDATTQQYKITLPEQMDVGVYASLDVNNDGNADYYVDNGNYGYSSYLQLNSNQVVNANTIYLIDLNVHAQIKISLLDSNLEPLLGAEPSIADTLNGTLSATYNATDKQYVFDAIVGSNLTVMIPSFVANNKTYNSSNIQITRMSSVGSSRYSLTSSSNYSSTVFNFLNDEPQIFTAVIQPNVNTANSNLSVASMSTVDNVVAEGFKVFYTGPVALKAGSVQLVKKNALKVTRGNESATDLILAGTTDINIADELVEFTADLSLNNTLLTVTPKTSLAEGYNYSYAVNSLQDNTSNTTVNVYSDYLDFYAKNTSTFAITDMKLDNNDYYTNGNIIHATNTANEAATATPSQYYGQSVSVFLPASIENLKTLTLRKEKVTKDNVESNTVAVYSVVVGGAVNISQRLWTVSLASNEAVVGTNYYYWSILKGTGLSDGQWYQLNVNESLNDNTGTNANSISLSYALETKSGVIETGTITLPVL